MVTLANSIVEPKHIRAGDVWGDPENPRTWRYINQRGDFTAVVLDFEFGFRFSDFTLEEVCQAINACRYRNINAIIASAS